eukprot:3976940-Amphidinium_carterae.2
MFLVEHARSARNLYLESTSVDSLPLEESKLKIVAMLHVSASLKEYLDSPAGLEVTRRGVPDDPVEPHDSRIIAWHDAPVNAGRYENQLNTQPPVSGVV